MKKQLPSVLAQRRKTLRHLDLVTLNCCRYKWLVVRRVAATLYHTITLFEEQVPPSRSDDTSNGRLCPVWGHIDAMVTKNAQEIS
jgi:hypothetical protein